MRSSVKTPPSVRKAWSSSRLLSTASSEPGTVGMAAASSGGSSYRSLSTGSGGSILFLMPSVPALRIAEKARYGLADGSGTRNSIRLAFGLVPVIGMRQHADRFRAEYTRLTGASKPGTRRWQELTVGLV